MIIKVGQHIIDTDVKISVITDEKLFDSVVRILKGHSVETTTLIIEGVNRTLLRVGDKWDNIKSRETTYMRNFMMSFTPELLDGSNERSHVIQLFKQEFFRIYNMSTHRIRKGKADVNDEQALAFFDLLFTKINELYGEEVIKGLDSGNFDVKEGYPVMDVIAHAWLSIARGYYGPSCYKNLYTTEKERDFLKLVYKYNYIFYDDEKGRRI